MIKGVIFDFDGVIADTERINFENLQNILIKYKYELKEKDFLNFMGQRTIHFLKGKFPLIPERDLNSIYNEKRKMQEASINRIKVISGLLELLKYLKANKYKTAVATVSSLEFLKKTIEFNEISQYFDNLISEQEVTAPKPNPESYETALKKMGLTSTETIVIEDSNAGIKAGKAAGCKVFAVNGSVNQDQSEADKIFDDHFGVLRYFKENL